MCHFSTVIAQEGNYDKSWDKKDLKIDCKKGNFQK
jgi:hypothetical protein